MQKYQQGQGLLEAVVATAIIVGGISGVIALAGNQLRASNITTQQVVAVNLAREGVELVKNIRDSNWLEYQHVSNGWRTGLNGIANDFDGVFAYSSTTKKWSIDFAIDDWDEPETTLYRDAQSSSPTYGMYQENLPAGANFSATPYRRMVFLKQICANDVNDFRASGTCPTNSHVGYRVLVEVQWDDQTGTRSIQVEERMYNWK